jgi:phosphoglycolate phosphatase
MALVLFGDRPFDARLIIFDKDGTLIEFEALWAAKTIQGIERLVGALRDDPRATGSLRTELYAILGYDPSAHRFAPHGPLITAAMPKLYTLAAGVLYRHGWGWLEAELLVERELVPGMRDAFDPAMLKPFADLPALFATLAHAGVGLAVVTSDDAGPAARTLALLGVDGHVGFVAGADSGYAPKPGPEAVLAACGRYGVDPAQVAVVGDSTTDLLMGRRAGAGLCVAVCSGLAGRAELAPAADIVLESIAQIALPANAAHHPQGVD